MHHDTYTMRACSSGSDHIAPLPGLCLFPHRLEDKTRQTTNVKFFFLALPLTENVVMSRFPGHNETSVKGKRDIPDSFKRAAFLNARPTITTCLS